MESILVAQIVLLLLVGRGIGEIMQRFGQPAVLGQLLAGLIMGPSLFGWAFPAAHDLIFPDNAAQKYQLVGISNFGILLLLLLTGMEADIPLVRKVGVPAVVVAATGVVVPFAAGFLVGQYLPSFLLGDPDRRLVASLFMGTALSISSIKIVAAVVREMNFMRRDLGQIIVAAAIMEDTACWVIISLILHLGRSPAHELRSAATALFGTALFLGVSYTVGRRFIFWLIRTVNDSLMSDYAVLTVILVIMGVMALISDGIGVGTLLGAFTAGVLIGESPMRTRQIEDQLRGFVTAFIMPIFFGLSGLGADLGILRSRTTALLALGLVAAASIGKFAGAFAGGIIGGLTRRQSLALGCGMNARGSTEVIVARTGLSVGVLTADLYSMIVLMAVMTTMSMPPLLRWALAGLPVEPEEQARLDREEADAGGFVSRFERILITADRGANGRLASRLAGFVAGLRGTPLTVVHFTRGTLGKEMGQAPHDIATDGARRGNEAAAEEKEGHEPSESAVSSRVLQAGSEHFMLEDMHKGYDIIFIGLKKMITADGILAPELQKIMSEFEGPVALVFAGNSARSNVKGRPMHILTPITGTLASRRGAEIAVSLFPAKESTVAALLVADPVAPPDSPPSLRRSRKRRAADAALFADVSALARRNGYNDIGLGARTDVGPHDAIIEEAARQKSSVIVMGVHRRTETSYLGETAEFLLREWPGPLVLLFS